MSLLWILVAILVAIMALMAYVRLAPTDVARVHCNVDATQDEDGEGHCTRVITDPDPDAMARIDAAALALPRTTRLAGSVADGHVTYVTRSKLMGFPDYTTVQRDGDTIRIFGRLRFGKSDLGVNRTRVTHLVAAATA